MSLKYRLYNLKADQFCQQMFGGTPRQMRQLTILVQRKALIFLQEVKQHFFPLGISHQLTTRITALLPHPQVYRRGKYVFVFDTQISQRFSRFVFSINRFSQALFNLPHQHIAPLGMKGPQAIAVSYTHQTLPTLLLV